VAAVAKGEETYFRGRYRVERRVQSVLAMSIAKKVGGGIPYLTKGGLRRKENKGEKSEQHRSPSYFWAVRRVIGPERRKQGGRKRK